MTAARYDITIDQGSDFALELIVKESNNPKDFTPTDGKSWGARAKFRKTLEDDIKVFNLGAAVVQNTDGKVTLDHAFNANPTATAGTYLYDLEIFQHNTSDTSPNYTIHKVTRLLTGNLTLRREVTR